ncbi:MbtH family protein [Glutamicibacter sp. NPDC087344]|uniref:MbtH family protein n=1 Tax=Glutamicibacter sp. NPDC087344 TaxID=3363994 RepID=UPI003825A1B1
MNPFDRTDGSFLVLVNHLNQHSIWPEFAQVPEGWNQVFGPAALGEVNEYVEEHWSDITPRESAQ